MKTKGRHLQRVCQTRWLSSETTVRARSEILTIWAALKQMSENKNDGNVRYFTATYENKKCSTWCFPFSNIGTSGVLREYGVDGCLLLAVK